MTDYSIYPDSLDSYGTLPLVRDGIDEILARHHNALRDAIWKIESELGAQPSGTFGTVRDRLDSVSDASALIDSHLIDSLDAHDASAISILDAGENYVSTDVEGAIAELAAILPRANNTIGENNTSIPNSGIPNFVDGSGSLFLLNQAAGTITKKTQPIAITGIHVIEVGESNGSGTGAQLQMASAGQIQWKAPGDSFGTAVDLLTLTEGDVVTVSSGTATKKIRVARNSASLPSAGVLPIVETFDVLRLNAQSGAFSDNTAGIIESNFITRTAISATGTSLNQFVIGGIVYPADRGTLVLQRKLRGSSAFAPIAVLDLAANFDETYRATEQPVYCPSLVNYDTITLYDRLPSRPDYEELDVDADGSQVYENFDLSAAFTSAQLAKYAIPVSNEGLVGGTLEAATDTTAAEINANVSAYRVVHYRDGVSNFNGEPAEADVLCVYDSLGAVNDGDNNVRMSNVFLDTNATRPNINQVLLNPVVPAAESVTKFVSGVNYYNGIEDKFDLELRSETDVFSNSYLKDSLLTVSSNAFHVVSGDGYGLGVAVTQMMDDGYAVFSDSNVPVHADTAYYLINASVNTARRFYPEPDKFDSNARVSVAISDPFGAGTSLDAYGFISSSATPVRVLINSYDEFKATNTIEYFCDESRRISNAETFNFNLERDQYTHAYDAPETLEIWDNQVALSAGELQVGGGFDINSDVGGLVFPQSDYSSGVAPFQDNTPDYSAAGYTAVDEAIYQRLFNLGVSTNSGKIRIVSGGDYPISFNDIRYGNEDRCVKISVKIPGTAGNSTGWLDLGRLYSTGHISDGDGCLYGAVTESTGDFTVPFTFGRLNSDQNENMIAVRIAYLTSNLTAAKQKIMTRMELLPSD